MVDTAIAASTTRSLGELLDTLPQELYDHIYEEVFTAHSKSVAIVDRFHKPPALLQVDRASRAKFAKSYYGRTIFVLKYMYSFLYIEKLHAEHVNLLKDIRTRKGHSKRMYKHGYDVGWGRKHPWQILYSSKVVREHHGDAEDIVLDLIEQGLVEGREQDWEEIFESYKGLEGGCSL